jgi:hypothetical protein
VRLQQLEDVRVRYWLEHTPGSSFGAFGVPGARRGERPGVRADRRDRRGVVYVNRRAGATTGAWPGTQSLCGLKPSGSTGEGGLGPWYLPQFMREQSRTIVE